VDDSAFNEVAQSCQYLSDDVCGPTLIKSVLSQVLAEVHLAVLHDHEEAVALFHHVYEFDDVGVVELAEDRGLVFDGGEHAVLEVHGHLFDGEGRGGVDATERTLPNY
jgi:hypothetical protein